MNVPVEKYCCGNCGLNKSGECQGQRYIGQKEERAEYRAGLLVDNMDLACPLISEHFVDNGYQFRAIELEINRRK